MIGLIKSEDISNSGQTVWYAFGLIHYIALDAFLSGPIESADKTYQKKNWAFFGLRWINQKVVNFRERGYTSCKKKNLSE